MKNWSGVYFRIVEVEDHLATAVKTKVPAMFGALNAGQPLLQACDVGKPPERAMH